MTTQNNLVANNDRGMLEYLMQAFDSECWNCNLCGNGEETKTMDSAIFLREYLNYYSSLSQPNEPVAWVCGGELYLSLEEANESKRDWSLIPKPLYAAPPNTPELEQANKVLEGKCKELMERLETQTLYKNTLDIVNDDLTAKLEKMRVILFNVDSEMKHNPVGTLTRLTMDSIKQALEGV